jgi:hypothetical protein
VVTSHEFDQDHRSQIDVLYLYRDVWNRDLPHLARELPILALNPTANVLPRFLGGSRVGAKDKRVNPHVIPVTILLVSGRQCNAKSVADFIQQSSPLIFSRVRYVWGNVASLMFHFDNSQRPVVRFPQ